MQRIPLTSSQRAQVEEILHHLESALDGLQHTCAYTSVIENVRPDTPGLQELHVYAYIPQSYGLVTATGAAKAMLKDNAYTPEYGALITGCLSYVLGYYQRAGEYFHEITESNPEPSFDEYLAHTREHAPQIKEHSEEALQALRNLLGDDEYDNAVEDGRIMQERIGNYRRENDLDCAPAAYY